MASSTLDAALDAAVQGGGTAAAIIAGSLWGAAHGATAIPGPARVAPDVSAATEELADAISVAHRAWVMDRPVAQAQGDPLDGSAVAHLLWTRFPGY